ncbi:PIN domain-containing protein [Limimaricola cinnabarinus]|uniref:PIN domain-containing protein n=1 Tax=Limimaricola cinnabarinus TaxID=1125964 RepID=UPI003D7E1005
MHLFIDTNVYLEFFRFTNEKLEELRKLAALVKEQQITLLASSQLRDEYYRNREKVLNFSFKEMRNSKREYKLTLLQISVRGIH